MSCFFFTLSLFSLLLPHEISCKQETNTPLSCSASTATLIRISTVANIEDMQDFLFNSVSLAVWSTVEPGVAIFAACLAILRPLLRKIFPNHFRQVAIPNTPELQIHTKLTGKATLSNDIELGNNVKIESLKRSAQHSLGESSRTIDIRLDNGGNDERKTDTSMIYDGAWRNSSRSDELNNERVHSQYTA